MIEDIDALRERFRTNIEATGLSPDQVIMANAPAKNIDESRPWALFQVTPGASEEKGFDTHIKVFQTGFVMLQIYIPKGQGSKIAYEIAQKFSRLFFRWRQRSKSGYVLAQPGYPRQVANDDFFQVNVFIPYDSKRDYPL